MWADQSMGLIHGLARAAEVVDLTIREARPLLRERLPRRARRLAAVSRSDRRDTQPRPVFVTRSGSPPPADEVLGATGSAEPESAGATTGETEQGRPAVGGDRRLVHCGL
jgi:hypothetical protein